MNTDNRNMPAVMQALHQMPFDYDDGDGMDFEPYQSFLPRADTEEWFRLWTGNSEADGSPYFIFGQDGSGGYAALWLTREGQSLLEQPIVFFGSEGEIGAIAQNFSDYLWLLAHGHGPSEAVSYLNDEKEDHSEFKEFAKHHATTPQVKPSHIVAKAQAEFPDFERNIIALCG